MSVQFQALLLIENPGGPQKSQIVVLGADLGNGLMGGGKTSMAVAPLTVNHAGAKPGQCFRLSDWCWVTAPDRLYID